MRHFSRPSGPGPAVSLLTADGRGAVAVVRVWGGGALAVADAAFRPARGKGLAETPAGRLRFGRVGAGQGDEVVAVVVAPTTVGRSPEVEVQCHGGPAAVALVVEALEAAGARLRTPGAWARHDCGSPFRARAAIELGKATTARVAEVLLDQADGALDEALRGLIDADDEEMRAGLADLVRWAKIGTRMVAGWRVALAGRPNVGKSRLLNALAGYERAIVDPTPGTTRDAVAVRAAFDGWPVDLVDTAGLRATDDPIEAEGVARARAVQGGADLVVVVLDRSEPIGPADRAILERHPGALVVANKCDLAGAWRAEDLDALAVSAERGDGVVALVAAIAHRIVPEAPPPGAGVPLAGSHARWLGALLGKARSGGLARARRSLGRWARDDRG